VERLVRNAQVVGRVPALPTVASFFFFAGCRTCKAKAKAANTAESCVKPRTAALRAAARFHIDEPLHRELSNAANRLSNGAATAEISRCRRP
jgi:hypothetical protein